MKIDFTDYSKVSYNRKRTEEKKDMDNWLREVLEVLIIGIGVLIALGALCLYLGDIRKW